MAKSAAPRKREYKYRYMYAARYRKETSPNNFVSQSVPGEFTAYDKALEAARSTEFFKSGEYTEDDIYVSRFRATPRQFDRASEKGAA